MDLIKAGGEQNRNNLKHQLGVSSEITKGVSYSTGSQLTADDFNEVWKI